MILGHRDTNLFSGAPSSSTLSPHTGWAGRGHQSTKAEKIRVYEGCETPGLYECVCVLPSELQIKLPLHVLPGLSPPE